MRLIAKTVVIKSAILSDENGNLIEVEGPFLYTPGFIRKPRKTRTPKVHVEKLPVTEPPKSLKGRKSPNFTKLKLSELVGVAKYQSKDGGTFPVGIADYSNKDGIETYILLFIEKNNQFAYHPEGGYIGNVEKMTDIRMFNNEQLELLRNMQS